MPLPAEGSPWPPKQMAPHYADMAEADVWYTGDKRALAEYYGRELKRDRKTGSLADRLWAQPVDLTQPERRVHVPIAGDIASASTDLLFSEAPTVRFENTTTQTRFDQLSEDGGLHMRLLEAAELGAALGDSYLTTVWDKDVVPDRPILTSWAGDMAIPTIRYGRLLSVVFWRELERTGDTVVRLLERHAVEQGVGFIEYGLYQGTTSSLGRRVPFTEHDDAAHIDALVDDHDRQLTGINQLTATHIPNARPNRKHRGHLGRSDFAAVYDEFDALDQVMTSWMRDIRLGQGRAVVPSGALQNLGEGRGSFFDVHREIYDELSMPPRTGEGLTVMQFGIRVEEHERTSDHLLATIARSCGYSPSTFGLAEEGAGGRTATEVTDRKSRSISSSSRKGMYWKTAIRRISQAWLALDAVHFKGGGDPSAAPTVELAPPETPSEETTARTLQMLESAGAISRYLMVSKQHPEWTESEIAEEVDRINADRGSEADPWASASTLAGNQLDADADDGQGEEPDPPEDE